MMIDYSVIVPLHNEQENIRLLYSGFKDVLMAVEKRFEIIFIDDGSQDSTMAILEAFMQGDDFVKLLKLEQHLGKSYALQLGFDRAQGRRIITLDGDCQYDPWDILLLIQKMDEDNLDVVCGWRKYRSDDFSKKIASNFANYLRRAVFRESVHDVGCFLRIYSIETLKGICLKREQHRFLTVILKKKGCSIGEIVVKHFYRVGGKSKYGFWDRLIKSVPDFFVLFFNKGTC